MIVSSSNFIRNLLTNGSSVENVCHHNDSPNSWLNHLSNIQHKSTALINILWSEKLHVLTWNRCFQLKCESSIHNIAFAKKVSCLNHLQVKTVQNRVDLDVKGQRWIDFFSGGNAIMDYGLILKAKSDALKLKLLNDGFVLLHFRCDVNSCGLLVEYCDVFISCLDSHSDGTHSLQRIHWWANDALIFFSKCVQTKKQTHLHLRWPEGEYIFSIFVFLCELIL